MDDLNPYSAPTTEIGTTRPNESPKPDGSVPLATLRQRFFGCVIDSVIMIVTGTIPYFGLMFFYYAQFDLAYLEEESTAIILFAEWVLAIVVISVSFLIINGYLLARNGQTVGKWVMNMRITDDQDRLVPLPTLFLKRYLFFWLLGGIPVLGDLITLGDSLAIFGQGRKCVHDRVAGTKVVMAVVPSHVRQLPAQIAEPASKELDEPMDASDFEIKT